VSKKSNRLKGLGLNRWETVPSKKWGEPTRNTRVGLDEKFEKKGKGDRKVIGVRRGGLERMGPLTSCI